MKGLISCPCCGVNGVLPATMMCVRALESSLGYELESNSAYRCEKHNTHVGGAKHSKHMLGLAIDVGNVHDLDEFLAKARLSGFSGFGIAHWGVHIDIREKLTFWKYGPHGEILPYE